MFFVIHSPGLEVVDGFLNSSLVVAHHKLMHARVVAANVLFCAAIWDGAEAKGRVLICRVLELQAKRKKLGKSVKTYQAHFSFFFFAKIQY